MCASIAGWQALTKESDISPGAAFPYIKVRESGGFIMVGVQYVSMEEAPTFDEYRTGYIAARWNVSDNCAKALQLFEIGFTISGASKYLSVTEGTVSKYHSELMDKIHENVVFCVTPSKTRFDVFGEFGGSTYAQGEADGKAARKEANTNVTDRQSQLDPEFRERQKPLNRGVPLSEIPKDLITIAPNVEVEQ